MTTCGEVWTPHAAVGAAACWASISFSWRPVLELAVQPMSVVEAGDELEDLAASLLRRPEGPQAQQLVLQGGEEALGHGVVVAVADGSPGDLHTGFVSELAEGLCGVLAALVSSDIENWSSVDRKADPPTPVSLRRTQDDASPKGDRPTEGRYGLEQCVRAPI